MQYNVAIGEGALESESESVSGNVNKPLLTIEFSYIGHSALYLHTIENKTLSLLITFSEKRLYT